MIFFGIIYKFGQSFGGLARVPNRVPIIIDHHDSMGSIVRPHGVEELGTLFRRHPPQWIPRVFPGLEYRSHLGVPIGHIPIMSGFVRGTLCPILGVE